MGNVDDTRRPDVTVIVPVYNTMPYLTACLDSLVRQSIGHDRLHVVAVDDGSTDGSGEELEAFAARSPGLFTVVHQENSGGPAAPCNRGLELATGRFVFFLGADDYLWDQALENLVNRADEWESDVIFGRMTGVGGRGVSQRLFRHTQPDVPFPHSQLPFAVANTKLFRRSLLEEHGIRYSLDLTVGSDQPFTIEAMWHARKISVLADDTYYYAVRRENAANISFTSSWRSRLAAIDTVMAHVEDLTGPGKDRDAILHRHFAWEISNRLRADFLSLEETEQKALCAEVSRLADKYLTQGISRRLSVGQRLRIRMAQAGLVDQVRRLVEFDEAGTRPALALGSEHVCLAYPGFGDLPEEWFAAVVENIRSRAAEAVQLRGFRWEGATLALVADTGLHPGSADRVRVAMTPVRRGVGVLPFQRLPRGKHAPLLSSPVVLEGDQSTGGSRLIARVDLAPLLHLPAGPNRRWAVRFHLDGTKHTYDVPAEGATDVTTVVRAGRSCYRLEARFTESGRMYITRRRLSLKEVVRDRLGRLRRR